LVDFTLFAQVMPNHVKTTFIEPSWENTMVFLETQCFRSAPWKARGFHVYPAKSEVHIVMQHPESHMMHFSRECKAIIHNQARGNMSHRIFWGNCGNHA